MSTHNPSVLISHPTGNQNVRNAVRSLVEHGMLAEFWTAIAWDAESPWNRLLPAKLRTQFARRAFSDVPREHVRSVPWREMVRLGTRSIPLVCSGDSPFSMVSIYLHFDRKVARRVQDLKPDVVYAYEGGALETFRVANRNGIKAIYELNTGHWSWKQKLMSDEAEQNSEFAPLLPLLNDSPQFLDRKSEELDRADIVVVPSEHVRRTLEGIVPDEKIRIISYGAPLVKHQKSVSADAGQPLKVLFVGSLAQHKGIGYLLEAVDLLGSEADLTLVGRRYRVHSRVDEACRRWKWFETLPHNRVLDLMRRADVLVLPSFSEGFGMVVTEALACGLPVIITANVGATDLIRDGQEGFVVPVRSAEAIADCLKLLHSDRALLAQMSHNAQITAAKYPWDVYRTAWAEAVREASCR